MPTVSIITPCFNYAHYLGGTLDSLLRQTFADWECLIADDGSTDASPVVARNYQSRDGRIRYLRQANRGPSAARNRALGEAAGKYVFFLDADDLLHPQALDWLVAAMENRSRRVCLMQARNFVHDPARDSFAFESRPRATTFLPNILADNLAPPHCYLAERDLVLAAGGFDEELRACEDWDLWIRLALLGAELTHVDRVGAYYRRHASSLSAGKFHMWHGALRVRWKAWYRLGADDGPDLPQSMLDLCRRTAATYLNRDWIRMAAKLARFGHSELSGQFLELARARGTFASAGIRPGELWARYFLYRFTRACQPPTADELQRLRTLVAQMRDALAAGNPRQSPPLAGFHKRAVVNAKRP